MKNRIPISFGEKKEQTFGVLDIGSVSVKSLLFRKQDFSSKSKVGQKRITILRKGLENYEVFGVFDGRDFEMEIMKQAIKKAAKEAGITKEKLIVGFPAHIFKARVGELEYKRKNPEQKIRTKEKELIFEKILKQGEKQISKEFTKESGILPRELYFLTKKVIGTKIDGYKVSEILGYAGRKIEFKVVATFLPRYYLENAEKMIEACGFSIFKILHQVQGQAEFVLEDSNLLFLDIGADFSQMFLYKKGILEDVSEFRIGARNFCQAVSEKFGISSGAANDLAERYQRGLLEEKARQRLHELFSKETQDWALSLEKKLDKKSFFQEILCYGGGANFPEIKEFLEEKYNVPVKILSSKDFLLVEDKIKTRKYFQFIPSIFLTYAI